MTGFHKEMDSDRETEINDAVIKMIAVLSKTKLITVPSALFAIQQITMREMVALDRQAALKITRATADYYSGKIKQAAFERKSAETFDRICAAYDLAANEAIQ